MCIGIPMQIVTVDGIVAGCDDGTCHGEEGVLTLVDLSLLADCRPGDWILNFLGAARRKLDTDEATQIRDALAAIATAMQGERDDDAFADLTNRTPTLPPHLEAARAAGRSEA